MSVYNNQEQLTCEEAEQTHEGGDSCAGGAGQRVARHGHDVGDHPRGGAQPQRDQHQEEEDGEQLRRRVKLGDYLNKHILF